MLKGSVNQDAFNMKLFDFLSTGIIQTWRVIIKREGFDGIFGYFQKKIAVIVR